MLDAIAASAGRYRGVAIVDDVLDARAFASLDAANIRAVRFNFVKHLGGMPDLDLFQRVVARIAPMGWHRGASGRGRHRRAHPASTRSPLPFVIDHMGLETRPRAASTRRRSERSSKPRSSPLDQGVRRRARLERGPAVHRRDPVRAQIGRDRAERAPRHRLAAPERRQIHAQRRRSRRPGAAHRPAHRIQAKTSGRQPGAAIRFSRRDPGIRRNAG